ncbi:hypothetical protein [Thalassospira sp. UBA1131]|uniref:hypothetical protein n=1 Tax=Thalassospira sp. UBA1131 TaxID=1947672 RepID=UPI0025E29F7C|nr:hypothetical protein [Thalassospira sp. UBA1131]
MTVEDRVTDQEGKYRIYGKPIIYGRFARKCPAGRQGVPGIAPRAAKSKMPSDAFLGVAVEMIVNLARKDRRRDIGTFISSSFVLSRRI